MGLLRKSAATVLEMCDRLRGARLARTANVSTAGGVIVRGRALIDIRTGNTLSIGRNVTLNSRNKGYHVNLHSPVKILADGRDGQIVVGDNTRIHGSCIHARRSIRIGANCLIAANCNIIDNNGHDLSFEDVANRINTKGASRPVTIGANVWLGANVMVMPGVTIGEGTVVAANSVVLKDLPAMVLAAGNPARVVKVWDASRQTLS